MILSCINLHPLRTILSSKLFTRKLVPFFRTINGILNTLPTQDNRWILKQADAGFLPGKGRNRIQISYGVQTLSLLGRFNVLKSIFFFKFTKMRFEFIENKIYNNVLCVKPRILIRRTRKSFNRLILYGFYKI